MKWNDSAKNVNGIGYCFVPVKAKNNKMSEWNLISTSVKLLGKRWGFTAVSCQAWRVILWLMSFQWFKSGYGLSLDRTNKSSQICLWETLQNGGHCGVIFMFKLEEIMPQQHLQPW